MEKDVPDPDKPKRARCLWTVRGPMRLLAHSRCSLTPLMNSRVSSSGRKSWLSPLRTRLEAPEELSSLPHLPQPLPGLHLRSLKLRLGSPSGPRLRLQRPGTGISQDGGA